MFIVKGFHIDKARNKVLCAAVALAAKNSDVTPDDQLIEQKLIQASAKTNPEILSGEFALPKSAAQYAQLLKQSGKYIAVGVHTRIWKEVNGAKQITDAGRPKLTIEPYPVNLRGVS